MFSLKTFPSGQNYSYTLFPHETTHSGSWAFSLLFDFSFNCAFTGLSVFLSRPFAEDRLDPTVLFSDCRSSLLQSLQSALKNLQAMEVLKHTQKGKGTEKSGGNGGCPRNTS